MTNRATAANSTASAGSDETFSSEFEPVKVQGEPRDSEGPRDGASAWGIFAGVAAAALLLAISPSVASRTFTPKYVVVLVIAGVGLVPLITSLGRGRRAVASWAAVAFLGVGLVAALVSAAPALSLVGLYLWGTGWLMWLGCAGAFAVGLHLRSRADYEWVFGGLVVGAMGNAVVAIYQTVGKPSSSTFGAFQGTQADGLLGNPIHLEALLLGVLAIVAVRASRSVQALKAWTPVILLMSVALEFTRERLAVLLLPLLLVGLVLWQRRRGVAAAAAIAVGYAVGYLGGGSGLGERITQGSSSPGFSLRIDIWKVAVRAVAHHPLIGSGPGLFESATAHLLTRQLSRELGPGVLFSDAHDIILELAVTTGVLGLVCCVLWVWTSLARARNPLFLFAIAALAVELVEPLNIAITPLAFLALGACQLSLTPTEDLRYAAERLRIPLRACLAVLTVGAVVFGSTMLVGDAALSKSPTDGYVLDDAKNANNLLPYWPQSSISLATMYLYLAALSGGRNKSDDIAEAVGFLRESPSREPFDPLEYVSLGNVELDLGHLTEATADYRRALEADPWCAGAFQGLAAVFRSRQEWARAAYFYRLELTVTSTSALRLPVERALRRVEQHSTARGSS